MTKNEAKNKEYVALVKSDVQEPNVRIDQLSHVIRTKRWAEHLTLEEASKQIGISAATLSRWERKGVQGSKISNEDQEQTRTRDLRQPDMDTVARLARWAGVPIDSIVETMPTNEVTNETDTQAVNVATPDVVEAYLRADRNLDNETATALARMFRVAYEQFSRFSSNEALEESREVDL